MTPPRGKPAAMKALASLLYAMGNMSFCSIARLLGVSDVAVLNWIRDEARKAPKPQVSGDVIVVTLDEMWHFVQKKVASSGFGGPMTLWLGEPSPGLWVAVMTNRICQRAVRIGGVAVGNGGRSALSIAP